MKPRPQFLFPLVGFGNLAFTLRFRRIAGVQNRLFEILDVCLLRIELDSCLFGSEIYVRFFYSGNVPE